MHNSIDTTKHTVAEEVALLQQHVKELEKRSDRLILRHCLYSNFISYLPVR